jgi:hypothetical protein
VDGVDVGFKPSIVDGVDVERQVPVPLSSNTPCYENIK